MRKLALGAGVVALVGALAMSAWAQPGGRACGRRPMGGGMERMHHGCLRSEGPMGGMTGILGRAEDLELKKEQIEKIRDLATDWAVKRVDRTAALQKARLQLAEALRAEEVDMEKVEKRLDTVLQAQKDLKLGQIRHMAEVCEVLTEEQREKLGAGVMGCPMMGGHYGREMQAPGAMHHGRGMRGGRGCSMLRERPGRRMEGPGAMHHGRGMHR